MCLFKGNNENDIPNFQTENYSFGVGGGGKLMKISDNITRWHYTTFGLALKLKYIFPHPGIISQGPLLSVYER